MGSCGVRQGEASASQSNSGVALPVIRTQPRPLAGRQSRQRAAGERGQVNEVELLSGLQVILRNFISTVLSFFHNCTS